MGSLAASLSTFFRRCEPLCWAGSGKHQGRPEVLRDREALKARCESRLGPCRHRKAADKGKLGPAFREFQAKLAQGGVQSRFSHTCRGSRTLPGASPCSAPGRSASHFRIFASISSAEALGNSRRRFCCMMDSPKAYISSAVRNFAAASARLESFIKA
jgi:hypothetical protein